MNRTSWFWVVPFVCFLGGYLAIAYRVQQHAVTVTPSVVGISIQKALFVLSGLHLSGTVIGEREDAELPPGTIFDQIPAAGQVLRPLQAVGLIVTKEPSYPTAPQLMGKHEVQATERAIYEGLRVRVHTVPVHGVQGIVCAQSPQAGEPVPDRVMHLYTSSGTTSLRIMPDVRGLTREHVMQLCTEYGIAVQVHHRTPVAEDHCCNCAVVEQMPAYGALVDIARSLTLQVMVDAG